MGCIWSKTAAMHYAEMSPTLVLSHLLIIIALLRALVTKNDALTIPLMFNNVEENSYVRLMYFYYDTIHIA